MSGPRRPILAGIETEYGLLVEGRGAEEQIDDAMALVRGYPGECLALWDYRHESPRRDLRGFVLDRLAFDPEDAKFDAGRTHGRDTDVRSDRILPNGARLYNDHGHPEYSTPECLSLAELALHDAAGEIAVLRAARALEEREGRRVRAYKNNTDFHGASYGTHESYLVPREVGFERLFRDVLPMLVVRQVLTGAGKVGAESGRSATYQLSQRADFFAEPANTETLFRRPIFNTRDEPHADPRDWIRLHVISGDANMIPAATARKAGLVKLALRLCEAGAAPLWRLADPVRAFQAISRDERGDACLGLDGRRETTAHEVLESYFAAAERALELDAESVGLIAECRALLEDLERAQTGAGDRAAWDRFRRSVDWAAKRAMLEGYMEAEGTDWRDPALVSFDLEYHNLDPDESLLAALREMGEVEPGPPAEELEARLRGVVEPTRARARGVAVSRFGHALVGACWRSVTFRHGGEHVEVDLPPDAEYPAQLAGASDVESFIQMLRSVR